MPETETSHSSITATSERTGILNKDDGVDFERKYLTAEEKLEILHKILPKFKKVLSQLVAIKPEEAYSEKVYQYLKEKGFNQPTVEMLESEQAEKWLREHKLIKNNTVGPDAIYVFNFPRSIAHWWRKGKPRSDNDKGIPAEGAPHEWGKMYANKLQPLWALLDLISDYGGWFDEDEKNRDYYQQRVEQDLELLASHGVDGSTIKELEDEFNKVGGWGRRINLQKQHDSKHYYYIWGWYLKDKN